VESGEVGMKREGSGEWVIGNREWGIGKGGCGG